MPAAPTRSAPCRRTTTWSRRRWRTQRDRRLPSHIATTRRSEGERTRDPWRQPYVPQAGAARNLVFDRARRLRRPARPQRRRKDDAVLVDRRAAQSAAGIDPPARSRPAGRTQRRTRRLWFRLPAVGARSRPHGGPVAPLPRRAARPVAPLRSAHGSSRSSSGSTLFRARTISCASCPAASAAGSRSRAPCCIGRGCCCSTRRRWAWTCPAAAPSCSAFARSVSSEGTTALWATHLLDEVEHGDRTIVLHEGRILDDRRDIAAASLPDYFARLASLETAA